MMKIKLLEIKLLVKGKEKLQERRQSLMLTSG